jgi:DNA-binding GntR family transcriptional regulator
MMRGALRNQDPAAEHARKVGKAEIAVTLMERAYCELEEQIVTLHLKPGEVLSESTLSESLRIGRTPIREALQRLAREGLVRILPHYTETFTRATVLGFG